MKTLKIKKPLKVLLMAAAAVFFFSCGGNNNDNECCEGAICGNGVCDKGEDIILLTNPVKFVCDKDCPGTCGDGLCNPEYENHVNCPQDCSE